MVIKASSSGTVDRLIADLASDDSTTRDAAVARLTVIGARALQRLLALSANEDVAPRTRAAAFRALEGIGDPRALAPGLRALESSDITLAVAAIGVARSHLRTKDDARVLDHLTRIALSSGRPRAVRVAAFQALSDVDATTLEPLRRALASEGDGEIASAAAPQAGDAKADEPRTLSLAAEGALPDDPAAIVRALAKSGNDVPLPQLTEIIEKIRIHEGAVPAKQRGGWISARAALHGALAHRGSRLALYDLRETVESAHGPLGADFLGALTTIGDESCLEALASAHARTRSDGSPVERRWRSQMEEAFAAIAARIGITRRHAVAKKIEKRWPGALAALLPKLPGSISRS